MAFAFRQNESISKGVQRVIRKQLEDAKTELTDDARKSIDERIHSVRKRFKRVRAVVRLVRSSIGSPAYRKENETLRDVSRPLSEVRDAKVLIEAVDKLEKISRRTDKTELFGPVRASLKKKQKILRARIIDHQHAFSKAADAVDEALQRLSDWGDFPTDWKKVAQGIKRVYRNGRDALDCVKADPSVVNLHEWRKQVKYFRHQMELLAPSWPEVVGDLATQAEEIGDILGEDHDLAVLQSLLKSETKRPKGSPDILQLISRRRTKLQAKAVPKGELLYRERPREFVARLTSYWKGVEKWPKRQEAKQLAVVAK